MKKQLFILNLVICSLITTKAATYTVSVGGDGTGEGTFRWALSQAWTKNGGIVVFNIPNLPDNKIVTSSAFVMPDVAAQIIIEGMNQANNKPVVISSNYTEGQLFLLGSTSGADGAVYTFKDLVFENISGTYNGIVFCIGKLLPSSIFIDVVLDNIVFKNCKSTLAENSGGGLIFLANDSHLTIKNCAFINNKQLLSVGTIATNDDVMAGIISGAENNSSNLIIVNTTFYGNESNARAGSILANNETSIISSTFVNNKGGRTGGVYINSNAPFNIINTILTNNTTWNGVYGTTSDFDGNGKVKGLIKNTIWQNGASEASIQNLISYYSGIFASYSDGIPDLEIKSNTIPLAGQGNAVTGGALSYDPYTPLLSVTPSSTIIAVEGGDIVFEVNATGDVDWNAEIQGYPPPNWLSIKNTTANSITFTAIANTSGLNRQATILFKDVNNLAVEISLTLNQMGMDDDPAVRGYALRMSMTPDASWIMSGAYTGKQLQSFINTKMGGFKWDYSETPNCTVSDCQYTTGDINGIHCQVLLDNDLGYYVYRFDNHITTGPLDVDRCACSGSVDRQRNEMKSKTGNGNGIVNGNYGEWQIIEWKFKIPKGYQPSSSFCHIHQLKAQEGANGAPLITLSLRSSNRSQTDRRLQVIHSQEGELNGAQGGWGTVMESDRSLFASQVEDQWLQVQEEMHYTREGYYRIKITNMATGTVVLEYDSDKTPKVAGKKINMWRTNCIDMRNKWGIYRSFGSALTTTSKLPSNGIKDEHIFFTDFRTWEKEEFANNNNRTPVP
ncbi:MAG: hypothetical protein LBU22_07020 [Dysgonamonadaceae bacterium]|jgi:hypothetical protein|nr:hypothetical protein [Dysgonamonadaceae bacterium]